MHAKNRTTGSTQNKEIRGSRQSWMKLTTWRSLTCLSSYLCWVSRQGRRFCRSWQVNLLKEWRQALPNTKRWTNESAECVLAGTRWWEAFTTTELMHMPTCLHGQQLNCSLPLLAGIVSSSKRLIASQRTSRPISRILCMYTHRKLTRNQELGQDPNKIWMLNKALYGWPPSGRIRFDKVSTCLHNYGFLTLDSCLSFVLVLLKQDGRASSHWHEIWSCGYRNQGPSGARFCDAPWCALRHHYFQRAPRHVSGVLFWTRWGRRRDVRTCELNMMM